MAQATHRSKRRSSPYIFQVVISLSIHSCFKNAYITWAFTDGSQEIVFFPLTLSAQDMTLFPVFPSDSNSRVLTAFLANTGGGQGAAFFPGDNLRTAQANDCGLNKLEYL